MSGAFPLAVVVLGVLATVPAEGPEPTPTWRWTVEERIAMRTNPVAARERVNRNRRTAASEAFDPDAAAIVDSFDGRSNPELFLPHEVFRFFISISFTSQPRSMAAFRGAMQDDLQRHGLPADFWQRLEALSATYAGSLAEAEALAKASASGEERRLVSRKACRNAAAALAAARREFGEERFDRFLYESVARGMFHVADELPDPRRLREQAEGCR